MKKALILIFLIVICYLGYGQVTYPVQQNLGSATTLVKNPNYGGFQGGLIPYTFSDTSAANTALTYLKWYCGATIYTTDVGAKWYRSCYGGSYRWVMIDPSGAPNTGNAWRIGFTNGLFTSPSNPQYIGTGTNQGFFLSTNSLGRLLIDSNGINRSSGSANKVLTFDTTTKKMYYTDGASATDFWSLDGNASTTGKFIGTTDAVGLMFKVNNVQAGYIDVDNGNTSLGENSAISITNGGSNVAIGYNALNANITGSGNTAVGASALGSVLGSYNTAIGEGALANVTGINNIAIGRYSAQYFTNDSNHLIINSLNRTNKQGDTTKSIIYGAQDATAANQRLYLNSQVYLPYATAAANAADSMMVILPSTGKVGYRAIPAGGGTPALTATYIGYGDGSNLLTGSSNLTWDNSNGYFRAALNSNGGIVNDAGNGLFQTGDIGGGTTGDIYTLDAANSLFYYTNINTNGKFGINTSNPTVALDVVGDMLQTGNTVTTGTFQMSNYGAGAATFDASGNITSVSDERLKTNIKPYKTGLKELLLIKPIQYKWNEKSKMETAGTYAGFSAQNVKAVIPLGTGENKDGYLSLQDRAIMATLVNAVQELSAKVDKLEKQNAELVKKLAKNPKKVTLKY